MFSERFRDFKSAKLNLERLISERSKNIYFRNNKYLDEQNSIKSRTSPDSCCEFGCGHKQGVWFAKLESNGIWTMVMKHLTKLTDVINAYHSCEVFQKHLEEKRKMLLLPKVFQVLRNRGHLQYKGFATYSDDSLHGDESRNVLKLRLVCKAWKRAAEEAFLIPVQNFETPRYWHPESWNWKSPMVCTFRTTKDLDKAMEKLQNVKTSGPLLRLVKVIYKPGHECDNFFTKLVQFLDVHGNSIWGFFWIESDCTHFQYNRFRGTMCKMTKLKALWLRLSINHENTMTEEEISNARAQLSQGMDEQSLPQLPELTLICTDFHRFIDVIVLELLTKTPNLKGFDLDYCQINHGLGHLVWKVLGSLRLEYFKLMYGAHRDTFINDLHRLSQFDWPLSHLHLEYFPLYDREALKINAVNFFEILETFSNTLIIFSLEEGCNLVFVSSDDDGGIRLPEFPNLQKFDIRCY